MAIYSFSSSPKVEKQKTLYTNWNASSQTANTQATTNNGGLLGGLGFLAEKLAVGFVSSIEGGVDYVTSGLAKLFGNDEWAEDIIANDWFGDWYSHPEEWYNPSGFMKTAGDVAGGIGTSLPGLIAATAITVATGGAGAGSFAAALAPLGAAVTSGLGAAGNAVKSAYKETGNLDAKTYGYGALSGFTEGSLEGVTTALSLGGGAVVKSFAKALGKETAKTVAKQGALKTLASSFAGEFFEEATSEILDPVWKRMTYDPSAAFATPQEVLYSGFVGGLSGVVMGGTGVVFDSGTSFAKGTNIANRGGATEVLNTANDLSSWATENNVDDEVFKTIEDTRNKLSQSLQQTGGQVVTVTQKKLLGDLYRQNVATSANMFVAQRALNIVSNAPQVAQRLSEYGYKHKTTGQTYSVTAEEITKGYDPSNPSSIYKALRENETLRSLAVSDATGKLLLDSAQFTHATLAGRKLASQVDFNRFLETATSQEINAVSQALGIDSWASLDSDSFAKKIEQFIENGGVQQNVSTRERTKMLQAIPAESARSIPKRINLKNGQSARYTDGSLDIGVSKDGDSYLIHDYKSGYTTKSLTASDVNKRLASYNTEKTAIMEDVQKQVDEAARLQREAAEADTYARENVDGYSELNEPNKGMIRKVIRDAKAKGISDADALLYARVSARSGVDVVFDSSLKEGESALYDGEKNRFVVNPNSKRGAERILIHELDHAIRQYLGKDGKVHAVIPYKEALKRVSPEIQEKIIAAYADQDTDVSRTELYLDEISAYHAEDILGNKNVLEKLLEVEPTLKDKILNFFKNASNDPNERLSGYAKKFYRTYKKMFDSFAERNAQANASEEGGLTRIKKSMPKPTVTGEEEEEKDNTRKSFSSISRTFLGDNYVTKEGKGAEEISVEEFKSIDYRETEGYRNYVQECLDNMRQSIPDFNEQDARKEIEDSIQGIVDVAVAMKEAGYDIIDDPTWRENGEVRKDSKKRALFSSLEPNSDYFTSSDISTICDKRKNFAEIYDDIVREEERRGVPESKRFFKNVDNYFYIHKVLADKGLTQPCRECYVESMRKNLAPMAEAFRTLITESNESNTSNPQLYEQSGKKKGQLKSNNSETRKFVRDALAEYEVSPESITIDMLSTEDGLATLKIQMPLVYEAFNSFYGQSKPKMPRGATPFRFGELTALLTKDDGTINKSLVKKIASTGGFRLQSYSDFQIQNFVDVLQVLFEAGTLGLTGHAYTKVPAFLEATKNTNLKRNISIFMYNDEGVWKIDRNDSFPMSLEEIYKVVDSDKSGNTGIIAVSQNEKMAAWVMANDDVAYFIPFHKSGVKMGTVRETIVREGGREILGYADIKDHTRQQSEVYADTADGHKANTKVKKPIDIYSFWDFENTENLSQKDLIKKNLTAYIDECKKAGYKPKFREYVENNASVLKNILRYGKELGYLTEDATIDDISFEHGGYRIPYGYYKCLVDYNLFTPDGKASPAERLSLKNYKFDEAVEFFKDSEKLRRTELLQQFANDGERQKYAKLAAEGMSNAELEKVIRQKRQEVVSEILDQGNSKSVRKAIDFEPVSHNTGYAPSADAYSYESLTKKRDLSVVTFPTELPMTENGKVDTNAVVARGRLNARKQKNPNNTETSTYVRVDDIGLDVLLSKNGMTHGIARSQETAFAVMKIGDVLKNSVAVNELNGSATRKAEMSYVLLGACRDSENLYVVRSVVSKLENNVTEIDVYQLSAVKGKKTETPTSALGGTAVTEQSSLISSESPIVSIADFLEYVKSIPLSNEVFSEDVAKKLGVERTKGTLSGDIRYAIDIDEAIEATRASISMEEESYKPSKRDKAFSLWTQFQIAVTNEQAGIEVIGKQLGIKDIESKVQAVRAARTEANEMIGGQQMRIGVSADKDNMDTLVQGEGLIPIMNPITKQGEKVTADFFGYLFHKHNLSRMTLKKRSMEWHQADIDNLKKDVAKINALKKEIDALEKQIAALGRTRHDMEIKKGLRERVKKLKAEAKEVNKRAKELDKKIKEFMPLEDKPVIGWTKDEDGHIIPTTPGEDATPVTAEESEELVARYEKDHPEFAEQAEKLWGFLKNLNQYRVDTGLLSKDNFDYLAELYPHYVPTYRVDTKKGIGATEGKYNMAVKTTVKTAKGSTKRLQNPDKIIARQVMETIVAGRVNQLANALYDASVEKGDTTHIEVVSRKKMTPEEAAAYDPTEHRPKDNEITFFKDGERITIRVSKEIFAGFDAFSPKTDIGNPLIDLVSASNKLFKRGVTSLNPAFLLRNTIRDIQDAGINTRFGKTFLKNYAIAQKEIATNGKYWQLYRAYGGFASTVFDFEKGTDGSQNSWGLTKAEGNIVKKTMTTIENANSFVEQLPRLAEFISSIEAGNSVEQAILDSADVTTNFARGGKLAKALNRTVMPFLNPSIQGFSKMVRNVTAVRTVKEAAILALKATIVGIAPMVLNMIMNGDDEDYKKLRDSDKENNFLIKAGDTFIKIPRGRVASALGGLVNRSVEAAQGEVVDWKDYADNVLQQVSPVDSMTRTILSPFFDVATNTTWYGTAIEGRQFENVAPKDRFDENTSVIAIAIAKAHDFVGLEASPKKIHYLLDQYSGVIGDFILPATTPKEEKDFFTGNFTLDPVMSNKLSTRFYDIYDEAQYADTAGDDTAKYQVRYLNRVKKAISNMYKEKSKTQNNSELSRAEKLEQTRVIQVLINKAYETAIDDYELMTKAIEATSSIEEEDIRFAEAYRLVYGAQASLEQYNKDVYEKMQYLNKGGVDYDSLYSFYFGTRGITSDKDRKGNTIAGSKRKKVVSYINKLGLSRNQKLLLIASMGYSPADGDVVGMDAESAKKSLLRYILTLKGASKEERAEIASICGFETKNGAILNTFHAKTA